MISNHPNITSEDMTKTSNPICVIGMHRSGTSMITQLLQRSGLDLGAAEDIMPPNASNPQGHFENSRFVAINDALLRHFGGSWDHPPVLKKWWETDPALKDQVKEARKLLQAFSGKSHWGWKDPRTTLLLPFWNQLLPRPRFVICLRNPLEVARSLNVRDQISLESGFQLWEQYLLTAIRDSEGYPRLFTFYDDYFSNPQAETSRLLDFCRLPHPEDLNAVTAAISRGLKHHASDTGDIIAEDDIPAGIRLLYFVLRKFTALPDPQLNGNSTAEEKTSTNIHQLYLLLDKLYDQRMLDVKRTKIRHLQETLEDRENQLGNLIRQVMVLKENFAEKEARLQEQSQQIAHLNAALAEQEANIINLMNTRSWRITAPMRMFFDRLAGARERAGLLRDRLAFRLTRSGNTNSSGNGYRLNPLDYIGENPEKDAGDWQAYLANPAAGKRFAVYASSQGNYFFGEIRDLITAGLREAGLEAESRSEQDGFDPLADWQIVVAPHEFFYLGKGPALWQQHPENLILVNTEQSSTKWFSLAYRCFPETKAIWDINFQTAGLIRRKGWPCAYLPLGYVDNFAPFREIEILPENYATCYLAPEIAQQPFLRQPFGERPIDVIFIGGHTGRRERFFASAAPVLAKYHSYLRLMDNTAPVIPGKNVDLDTATVVGLEQRAKILLNIHRGAEQYFEWHRIVMHGIWQKTLVISEPGNPAPPFHPGVDYVAAPLEEIPAKIDYYLSTKTGREAAQQIVDRAFRTLSEKCRFSDILRPLLLQLPPAYEARRLSETLGRVDI